MSNNTAVVKKETGVTSTTEATSLLEAISRAASDPATDMDKMERLFAMHEKLVAHQAEVSFNVALAQAQSEIITVVKNKTNEHTRSRYADLDTIINAISPIYTSHGFSISFNTEDCATANVLRVLAVLSHSSGHSRQYKLDAPLDEAGSGGKVNKTRIQATGSTNSYARRYLICMIFNVTTADDNDGNGRITPTTGISEALTPQQREKVQKVASAMHAHLKADEAAQAVTLGRNQGFDAEEKVFLFTFFDSKQRALLKKVNAMSDASELITDPQKKRLEARIGELRLDRENIKAYCVAQWNKEHFADLSKAEYDELDGILEGMAERDAIASQA